MKQGIIYKVTNTLNEKVYIGQTVQPLKERKRQHYKFAKSKHNYKFSNALNKYSKDLFIWEVIESSINIDNLNEKEIYYINFFNSFSEGYNSTPGGYNRFTRTGTAPILNNIKKLYNLETKEIIEIDVYNFIKKYYEYYKGKGTIYAFYLGKYIRFKGWVFYENIDKHRNMIEKMKLATSNTKKDFTIYNFINTKTSEQFIGNRIDFINKFNLSKGEVSRLVNGIYNKYRNWILKNIQNETSN